MPSRIVAAESIEMSLEDQVDAVEVIAVTREPPVVVDVSDAVRIVLERVRKASSGCALVTRADKLVGIFTERDLLLEGLGDPGLLDRPVSDYMTADPKTVTSRDSIRKTVVLMERGGFRNVPVVDDDGRVVACLCHEDMIAYLAASFADRILNLPPDPDQKAKTPEGA